MRKSIIPFILLTLFVVLSANSQVIKGALLGGFNLSQVDGDEVYGFHKLGFNVGAAAIIPIDDRWSFSIENVYSQKGAWERQFPEYNDTADFYYRLKLNYVEVPMMIHYEDREIITVGTGFSWGRLVGAKEWEYAERTPTNSLSPYSRNDFNWLFDVRFRIKGKLKANIRYSYSLAPIRTRDYYTPILGAWSRKQYNNALTFRLIYVFNEKQSADARGNR